MPPSDSLFPSSEPYIINGRWAVEWGLGKHIVTDPPCSDAAGKWQWVNSSKYRSIEEMWELWTERDVHCFIVAKGRGS